MYPNVFPLQILQVLSYVNSVTCVNCKSYFYKKEEVVNTDLMVPNVSCTHVLCTPSMCLPITVVSSLNTQAASRLYLSINIYLTFTWNYKLF